MFGFFFNTFFSSITFRAKKDKRLKIGSLEQSNSLFCLLLIVNIVFVNC